MPDDAPTARGMMSVWRSGRRHPLTAADLAFLAGPARQAAIAITNARLFAEAQLARRRPRGEPGQQHLPGQRASA